MYRNGAHVLRRKSAVCIRLNSIFVTESLRVKLESFREVLNGGHGEGCKGDF